MAGKTVCLPCDEAMYLTVNLAYAAQEAYRLGKEAEFSQMRKPEEAEESA